MNAGPTLVIFADMLRKPAGWLAGLVIFFAVLIMYLAFDRVGNRLYGQTDLLISRGLGIALYALFIFPVARSILREEIHIDASRWQLWTLVSVLEAALIWFVGMALAVIGYLTVPAFIGSLGAEWREILLETLAYPFLLGLFVWKVGLVCGSKTGSLARINHFVWERRRRVVLLYIALLILDIMMLLTVAYLATAMGKLAGFVGMAACASISTWLSGLLMVALYLDYRQSDPGDESVFA